MKIITSKNKIIPFIFLFACFASADNVDIKHYLNSNEFFNRDIDIDNDGVADKVQDDFGDERRVQIDIRVLDFARNRKFNVLFVHQFNRRSNP